MLCGLALLLAFGGGTHALSWGVLLCAIGIALLLAPPRDPVWGGCGWLLLGLAGWAILALLPSGFGVGTEWRSEATVLGIGLGQAPHAQPWLGLETALLAAGGLVGLGFILSQRSGGALVSRHLLGLILLLTLLAAGLILGNAMGWRLPWAREVHVFSWFPNRNQTATIFACGSVAAIGLGVAESARRSRVAFLAFVCGAVLFLAMLQSLSRGALLAWGVGVIVLFAGAMRSRARRQAWRAAIVIGLGFFSCFAYFGGPGRDRFLEFWSALHSGGMAADFRLSIFQDVLFMVRDHPIWGVGLGQFRYVFPQYRDLSSGEVAILHPESSLLWWLAELGIPGVLLVLGLLIRFGFAHFRFEPHRANALLRWSALCAVMVFLLHTLIDVGAHRIGAVYVAGAFAALAIRPAQGAGSAGAAIRRRGWRACGGVLLACGAFWLIALESSRAVLSVDLATLVEPHPRLPMAFEPHFREGVRLRADDPSGAAAAFRRARFLDPQNSRLAFEEGRIWYPAQRESAFVAFGEALRRSEEPRRMFRRIAGLCRGDSEARPYLRRLALIDPGWSVEYFLLIPYDELSGEWDATGAEERIWPELDSADKERLLDRFLRADDPDTVLRLWRQSVRLFPDARLAIHPAARAHALQGDYEAAAMLILDEWRAGVDPIASGVALSDRQLERLRARALRDPDDIVANLRLLREFGARGSWEQAERVARRILESNHPPPEIGYWLAQSLFQRERFESAWRVLEGLQR